MNRHMIGTMMVLLLLIGSASAVVWAAVVWAMDGAPGRGEGRTGPPPEAIEACKDKNEGAKVEIATPRGEKIKATCEQIDGQLVAVPEGGFRGPKVLPPSGPQSGQ